MAISVILLMAGFLRLLWIDQEGYANTYYAAAVKSMLTNWHNFFFASFDPAGFVSVDKPPLGLWLQTLSARLLGFDGVSLVLPQSLAGIAAVLLLYHLIRGPFGPGAGLFAALALAVTPVAVVTDRNNTPDALVVLTMVGAIWATTRALERGQLRWLLMAAVLVGLGFNLKMLQAYLVVPALVLTYGLMAPVTWRRKLAHLLAAAVVLLAVSLSWSLVVDLTPASERPFVGSSGTNSALSLALGYNGLGRLAKWLGLELGTVHVFGFSLDLAEAPGFAPGIGTPGLFRLFTPELAGQVSWLLPLALIGVVVGGWWVLRGSADTALAAGDDVWRQRQAILLWGTLLLTQILFFTVADFFHTYYLITLGPPVAAMAAMAIAILWRLRQCSGWGRTWLPLALIVTALAQAVMLAPFPTWGDWLIPLVVGGTVLAGIGLLLFRGACLATGALLAGMLLLLAAPTTWSVMAVTDGAGGSWLPYAGPMAMGPLGGRRDASQGEPPSWLTGLGNGLPPMAMTFAGPRWDVLDHRLLDYLQANRGSSRYLVATESSSYASIVMLATDEAAMALGGYQGWDEILSPEQLATLVHQGDVRFFLLADTGGTESFGHENDVNGELTAWVRANCTLVLQTAWNGADEPDDAAAVRQGNVDASMPIDAGQSAGGAGAGFVRAQQLYDCAM